MGEAKRRQLVEAGMRAMFEEGRQGSDPRGMLAFDIVGAWQLAKLYADASNGDRKCQNLMQAIDTACDLIETANNEGLPILCLLCPTAIVDADTIGAFVSMMAISDNPNNANVNVVCRSCVDKHDGFNELLASIQDKLKEYLGEGAVEFVYK